MDDIVKAALLKWPNVPHCYRWLALDARGNWYMRDDRIQAAGPFPQPKGSRIDHEKLRDFIHRNYGHDEAGAWFFQNGPQRVYLDLEAAPWVWRIDDAPGWPVRSPISPTISPRWPLRCSWGCGWASRPPRWRRSGAGCSSWRWA